MFDFMTVARALTDEGRVRIIMMLRGRELCVCQLTGILDLSPSTTSKHLSILRQARLIESRKHGKWVYYTLANSPEVPFLVRDALAWVARSMENSPAILADQRRIHDILAQGDASCMTPELNVADICHSLEIHTLADDSNT